MFKSNREPHKNLAARQCLVGSLTGAVASKSVTEACKGTLNTDGNRVWSAKAKGCFTARQTGRAVAKAGLSDLLHGCGTGRA